MGQSAIFPVLKSFFFLWRLVIWLKVRHSWQNMVRKLGVVWNFVFCVFAAGSLLSSSSNTLSLPTVQHGSITCWQAEYSKVSCDKFDYPDSFLYAQQVLILLRCRVAYVLWSFCHHWQWLMATCPGIVHHASWVPSFGGRAFLKRDHTTK